MAKKREQLALILCEDRKLDLAPMPVEKAYIIDKDAFEAYHLLHARLLPMQGEDSLVTVLSERDAIPLAPVGSDYSEEIIQKLADPEPIAREEFWKQVKRIAIEEHKNIIANAIKFCVLIVAVMFALAILITQLRQ